MEKIYWVDPSGNKTDFTNMAHLAQLQGKSGHYMPVFTLTIINLPDLEGSMVTGVSVNPRSLTLPITVRDLNYYELVDLIETLTKTLNPTLGDGHLEIWHHLTGRKLICRYVGGLEGADASNFIKNQNAVLQFRADDPYFYDIDDTVLLKYIDISGGTFFKWQGGVVWDNFFPINLTAGSLFSSFTVNNTGDIIAYPVWKIYNAGENVTLHNLTTGKKLIINDSWADGDNYEIDTRTKYKTIKKNGVNAWSFVSTNSDEHNLWGFAPGNNSIQIIMTGVTVNTYIELTYNFRYMGI